MDLCEPQQPEMSSQSQHRLGTRSEPQHIDHERAGIHASADDRPGTVDISLRSSRSYGLLTFDTDIIFDTRLRQKLRRDGRLGS
nr:hypothetical protein CFP56_54849 [Quercus suber]